MKSIVLACLLLSTALPCLAQYPFESYPAIKFKEYTKWDDGVVAGGKDQYVIMGQITIPKFFGSESLTLKAAIKEDVPGSVLLLYKGKTLVQKIAEKTEISQMNIGEPVRVMDVNGDGLMDIKLTVNSMGVGISAMHYIVIYLFQKPGNKFAKITYDDMFQDKNRAERDMDGDGNFEIVTMQLQEYKKHNYWLFNIYNYTTDGLKNVSEKFGYPLMFQYLNKDNYVAATIDSAFLRKHSSKLPPAYRSNK